MEPLAYGVPGLRPENIVNVDEVELEQWRGATTASLATRELSEQAGLHWEKVAPGKRGVPHCHSEEEEVFVILEGDAGP